MIQREGSSHAFMWHLSHKSYRGDSYLTTANCLLKTVEKLQLLVWPDSSRNENRRLIDS